MKPACKHVLACGLLGYAASGALGQEPGAVPPGAWPVKTVRLIVPSGPGGGVDTLGRLFGKLFHESLGQRFVIDNRVGAGTMLGTELAARSPADGYTLLIASAALAVNTAINPRATFDPFRELAPIAWVSSTPIMLAAHPSVPVKTVKDLIAVARSRKGQLNGASTGNGTTSHLSVEMFKQMVAVDVTHVPYNGAAPATIAAIGGEVDIVFASMVAVYPHAKTGRLRALAVTTARRSGTAPEVPAMAESIPGYESDNWYAFFAPAGTPPEVVARLNREVLKALKAPEVIDLMKKEGADPTGSTPDELAAKLKREVGRYSAIVRAARVRID
jgi:tripartite-type tricarboxylate transporter receptor subunit TctC